MAKAVRKPVVSGRRPTAKPRYGKPVDKTSTRERLVAKGLPLAKARELAGEGEDLTNEQIADRRIAWQKTLTKARR